MRKIESGEIHLWFVFYEDIRDLGLLNRYRQLLTHEERLQEKRFHFENDQRRYLVTRALVRTVLSRYASISPEQWLFSTNAYGKPEIANADPAAQEITFNISHTQGLIVLGVSREKNLGVDAENVHVRQPSLDIAEHFFSLGEVAALTAQNERNDLPGERQCDYFFQYWTLKEAYIKARGMGLSIPLNQFEFHFPREGQVSMSMHPSLNDAPSRWRFWQLRPESDFIVSVCVERSAEPDQHLLMQKIVPLESEAAFDCDLWREST